MVLSELGIWSQGGSVNRLARLNNGLHDDQNMPAIAWRAGQESVRSLSISMMIERLTECDCTILKLVFTSEPISSTGVLLLPGASHESHHVHKTSQSCDPRV